MSNIIPNLDNMTDADKLAALESIQKSIAESKEIQKKRIGENVNIVVDALKKIESDIRSRFDEVGNTIEKRVATIKDGRDGINGKDGRNGKDGLNGKQGVQGTKGQDGRDGRDGVDGVDGISVTSAHIDFDGSLIIGLSSGIELNVGEVLAPSLAESIKVITNGGGTSQSVLDTLASLQTQITNLIPSQTGNSGKFLTTNGTALSWSSVAGGLSYQGTWNASTNTPTLTSSVGVNGYYYIVATAGSTNLNGITDWQIGDWLMFNGSVWQKIDQSNTVTSVNGQTGAVSVGTVTSVAATAGTGITVTGSPITSSGTLTITNSAPDQTVVLTGGTGITTSGTYPSFTITNSSPDRTVALTGAGTTSVTGTYPNFTITSNDAYVGTVTSVTGTSPVASSGGATPAISLATAYGDTQNPYASKTANYVLAAPNGSAGVPTFRAVVAADIPTLNQNTTGTASNVTGTVAIANGGTGQTTATLGFNALAPSQTSNSGKYLTTDGTNSSWATVSVTPTSVSDQNNTSTGYFDLPAGTTAQRPASPAVGMIRYNTTESKYEVYFSTGWAFLGSTLYPYNIDYLVVAGGGGGGDGIAGAGGAGGYRTLTAQTLTPGTSYTVTVGAGGAGGSGGGADGTTGSTSTFNSTSSAGGGGGGGAVTPGKNGGSGGGAGGAATAPNTGGTGNTPSVSPSQGSNGGIGAGVAGFRGGGGGGGASAVGAAGTGAGGGNGGAGTASSITGTSVTRAGGGGGGADPGGTAGSGGAGGGGAGVAGVGGTATAGTANTGGGGGGGGNSGAGGAGGSGVVILAIPTANYSGTTTGSPTVTTSGSNTILTFTGSGSYTA